MPPGSLDAARTAGRAVYCERGGIGRIDKSDAVARADGVAMVLGNVRPGPVVDDFHAVPTVQLSAPDAARLRRWVRTHDRTTIRMSGVAPSPAAGRTAAWSPPGDPRASLVKPDVVAVGDGVLGAVPGDRGWALFSGSSASTARVSGAAALLRSRHDWRAPVVRSVLATTAVPLASDSVLRQGAGRAGADVRGARLALVVGTSRYREALEHGLLGGPQPLLRARARQRHRHPAGHQPRLAGGVLLRPGGRLHAPPGARLAARGPARAPASPPPSGSP